MFASRRPTARITRRGVSPCTHRQDFWQYNMTSSWYDNTNVNLCQYMTAWHRDDNDRRRPTPVRSQWSGSVAGTEPGSTGSITRRAASWGSTAWTWVNIDDNHLPDDNRLFAYFFWWDHILQGTCYDNATVCLCSADLCNSWLPGPNNTVIWCYYMI